MSKIPTYPTLLDEVLQINISMIKQHKHLTDVSCKLIWKNTKGKEKGSIGYVLTPDYKEIRLSYHRKNVPISYSIKIIHKKSNLGVGMLWFFVCPFTNLNCRKLYLINGYFQHRLTKGNIMYSKQVQSKQYRYYDKLLGADNRLSKQYSKLYGTKHMKKTYRGKPTKTYSKILAKIEKDESIPFEEYLNLNKMLKL